MKKQQLRGIAAAILDPLNDFFYGQKKQADGTFKTVKFVPQPIPAGGGDTIEAGEFTLSSDGTIATGGAISTTRTVTCNLVNLDGIISVGDKLNWFARPNYFTVLFIDLDNNTIVVSAPNDGVDLSDNIGSVTINDATGGATASLVNRIITYVLTIPTVKKLKLWQGKSWKTSDKNIFSVDGWSDGTIQNCLFREEEAVSPSIDDVNCLHISGLGPNGWTGLITAKRDTSYDITLTQLGSGLNITGKWISQTNG